MSSAADKSDLSPSPLGEEREMDVYARRKRRRKIRIVRLLVLIFSFLVTLGLISPLTYWRGEILEKGKIADRDIRAPLDILLEDKAATEKKREDAWRLYKHIYIYDSDVLDEAQKRFGQFMEACAKITEKEYPPAIGPEQAASLRRQVVAKKAEELGLPKMPEAVLDALPQLAHNPAFATAMKGLLDDIYLKQSVIKDKVSFRVYADRAVWRLVIKVERPPMEKTFDPQQVLGLADDLPRYVRSRAPGFIPRGAPEFQIMTQALQDLALALAQQPNIVYDLEVNRKASEEYLKNIEPVTVTIRQGELVIQKGATVTEQEMKAVKQVNAHRVRMLWIRLGGEAIFVAMAFAFLIFHIRKFHPEMDFTAASLWLVMLPILTALLLGRMALIFIPDPTVASALFPAGIIGILGLMLIDARMATVMVMLSSLLFGIAADFRLDAVLMAMAGGLMGMATLYRMRERKQFIIAGLMISFANLLCVAASRFLINPEGMAGNEARNIQTLTAALANGLMCIPLVYYMPVFFEKFFGVVTDMRLLELTARHELLTHLEREAPGTYQHSLNVAKLAETAADAIGANFLLVRAGAYFHDIGKIAKREYFTENQVTPEETNIHAKLTPHMSTLLIKSHIKDGIELARNYHLPPRVIDFIPMHHGTTLISYFYNQALQQYSNSSTKEPVMEDEFRYPGPKPQTPETAILMMADAVEATAHSMFTGRTVDIDEIRRLVLEAIRARFNDGQFDECHLTLHDLHEISESFVQTLRARFHRRVQYKKA
ncbi:MAG: HDIG domain-containing protein [Candidatus Sumerlaeota bacterium]|nr:HDIG domain-containing protein [Candidatus Sumerlaeota bacterium]